MSHAAVHSQEDMSVPNLDDSNQSSLEPSVTHQLSDRQPSLEDVLVTRPVNLSRSSAVILITTLSGITFVGSMSGGLLTVGLPTIAKDLNLPNNLLLW